jgi:hypothetical protein
VDEFSGFLAAPAEPGLPNGADTIRIQVEASGVSTPVGEATVTRACP